MKTIVERGASWGLDETKLLLSLWGQDLVQRQTTNLKRTKEVYERISEKLNQNSYERTAEQVRTRVFNMIAEYRRIIRDDQNSERRQKCVFFEALHKIYQAKHMDDVKSALDDYEPEGGSYSPLSSSMTIEDETGAHDTSTTTTSATGLTGGDVEMSTTNNNNNSNINNKPDNNAQQNNQSGTPANSSTTTTSSSSTTATATTLQPTHLLTNVGDTNETLNNTTSNNIKKTYSNLPNNQQSTPNNTTATSTPQLNSNNQPQAKSLLVSQNQQTTIGSTFISTIATPASTATSTNQPRQQSLLLPHTAASTSQQNNTASSTPLTKLTNATATNGTPSYITINSGKTPTLYRTNQLINHPGIQVTSAAGQDGLNGGTQAAGASRITPAIASHQLYQAPVNTFDVTSSALLIDRVFAHLSRESENMREWISLEKERLALERARRQHEAEREARRERILVETLMRFQKEWIENINRIVPNAATAPAPTTATSTSPLTTTCPRETGASSPPPPQPQQPNQQQQSQQAPSSLETTTSDTNMDSSSQMDLTNSDSKE